MAILCLTPISRLLRWVQPLLLPVCCLTLGAAWAQTGGDADLDDFANVPAGDSTVAISVPATPYPVGATVRYFSTNGNNATGDGLTPATAWRTLTRVLSNDNSRIPTGATLVFAEGRYPVDGIALNRALTLQPAAGARAWLVGSEELPAARWEQVGTTNVWRTTDAQPWTARFTNELQNKPETIKGVCPGGGNSSNHFTCPPTDETKLAGYRDQVFVDDKPLKQVLRLADLRPGRREFFVDEANNRLYIGINPAGRRVEATAYEKALTLNAAGPNLNQRIVVRGLGFRNYAAEALTSTDGNFVLENCTFAWGATEGVNLINNAANSLVKGNTFVYNGRMGLRVSGYPSATQLPSNLVIENNICSYNNHEGFAEYWSAGGLKLAYLDDVIIRNNLFDSNYGTGLWLDLDVEQVKVLGNIARNNKAIGLFYEVSRGGLFAGNVAYGNGAGLKVSGSSGVAIYHNTLVNNKVNLDVSDYGRLNNGANVPAAVLAAQNARGILYETYEVTAKNNVLGNGERANLVVTQGLSNPEQGRMIEPGALNHNLYLRWTPQVPATATSGGKYYMVHFNNLGPVPATGLALKYATLADFRAGGTPPNTIFETNGTEVSNKAVGQLFANAAAQDFRLRDCPATWTIPAADQVNSNLVVAAAIGNTAAFMVTPAEFRAALGLPAGATLQVGGLQQTVNCLGVVTTSGRAAAVEWLELYPNPAQATLHVRLAGTQAGSATLLLHNSLGQRVLSVARTVGPTGEWVVAVGHLAPGPYWATVHLPGSRQQSIRVVLIQP